MIKRPFKLELRGKSTRSYSTEEALKQAYSKLPEETKRGSRAYELFPVQAGELPIELNGS